MRRITFALMSTIAAVILLFSYRTSTRGAAPAAVGTTSAGVVSGGPSTGPSAADTAANTLVNGSVAQTRWGPVQVQVTIADGRITDVQAIRQPDENRRDREINGYALPQLREAVLAAQSAQIDSISGATVTSDGYVESLQAALDVVKLG